MSFDDLTQRMGKRNGFAPELIANPAALARKHERKEYLLILFSGIVIVGVVGALTLALAATGWWMPQASGLLLLGGGLQISLGAKGLLKLHRSER